MTDLRGRTFADLVAGLNAGQHITVDAVVAFVDGELTPGAHARAEAHLTSCQTCAAEVAAQRQARSVVRSAGCPQIPAGLMAALCDIPQTTDLPGMPDELAVSDDGTVVTVADPTRAPVAPLGGSAPLGTTHRWGVGPSILGRRIGRTGAGAVVSGLVLGALIMSMVDDSAGPSAAPQPKGSPAPAAAGPSDPLRSVPVAAAVDGAIAPALDPGAAPSDRTALLLTNSQTGWHALQQPR